MTDKEKVLTAFQELVGTSGIRIQDDYGMDGDWCAMTIWKGFQNAGLPNLLLNGRKSAWVPDYQDYYIEKGLFGSEPQPGALVLYDFNSNGTADHIEFVESVNDDGTFVIIGGNTGDADGAYIDAVIRKTRNNYGVLGFAYPEYKEVNERKKKKMEFIVHPYGKEYMAYCNGSSLKKLSHPDQVVALNEAHALANGGVGIPIFMMGAEKYPIVARLLQVFNAPTMNDEDF